jgi:hypothetical protein
MADPLRSVEPPLVALLAQSGTLSALLINVALRIYAENSLGIRVSRQIESCDRAVSALQR